MPMFSIPLSGLDSASEALTVISNNLANLNTVGYKKQDTSFKDLFYQTIGNTGSGDPTQIGAGAGVGSITTNFMDGSLNTSGVATDVAITGDGFFVTQKSTGEQQYTRDGHFTVGLSGNLTTQDGEDVMGYPAVNGVITPGQTLSPIVLGQGLISPPKASGDISMTTNLDASTAVGQNFSTPMSVYDSLGVSHVLTFQFTKSAANTWNYNITIPAADVGQTGNPVSVSTGTLTFDGNGTLVSPAANITGITVPGLADGAAAVNLTWNLFDSNNNPLMTQVASASTTATTSQDGYSSGTLVSFNVGADGVISGTFTNGKTTPLGQLALATFPDEQGLLRVGSNYFNATLPSGAPTIGVPGAGGRGTLTGGALEQSNVDIATEFAAMIVAQRGFQASAKVVTTFDETTQDTINLIRQ
ncbi:MAG TPA: flagellar hook protein FlgE [Terriglobales bacterium]|nr:flagellar hook protein FlgE [Terriglobales bacterium]